MSEAPELVRYEVRDRIARIEINRPEKRNAINRAVTAQLQAAFERLDEDNDADAAVLFGAGQSFSSGADVGESQMGSREEMKRSRDPLGLAHPFAELLHRCRNWKPVIAAAHGHALGMALGLMLECDLIVAEEGTRFQVTETSRGLGGYQIWSRMVARGAGLFADEVCLTGRFFTAEEALAAGLLARVAPKDEWLSVALALAGEITRNPPLGVRETVRLRRWRMSGLIREIAFQAEPSRLHLTEDFAEAVRAFAEKRPPGPFKAR